MKDCRDCKDYRDCSGHIYVIDKPDEKNKDYIPWYHYGEIRFCPYQVIWILEHSEVLLTGDWPQGPGGSSYTDPSIRTGFRAEAYFIKAALTLGEVEARLKTTGDAGEALVDEAKQGLSFDQLSRPAHRALMYVKGWKRKRMSFSAWKKKRKYEKKLPKSNFIPLTKKQSDIEKQGFNGGLASI